MSTAPIDMVLHCPVCHEQHVDVEEPIQWAPFEVKDTVVLGSTMVGEMNPFRWKNPPHRSHLCHACGCVWRPADVPTNGVASINTSGRNDTWRPG